MIEQRFRAGVRFLWNKPNDGPGGNNGDIVASVRAANNLTYDGLDGHQAVIDPTLLAANAAGVLGMAKGANVPHNWLDYAPGYTARLVIGAQDILTGYMSGCLIVRGTYGGAMSAFHVGTIVGNVNVSQTVKREFAKALPADATAFEPAAAWQHGEIALIQNHLGGGGVATDKIFALVTAAGAFHSLLMFNLSEGGQWVNPAGRRYWCVGGIKAVQPMTRARLLAKLLS